MKANKSPQVVIVTGNNQREAVRQAVMRLGEDFAKSITQSKQIFVHPNLVTNHRKEATTNVETVRGVIDNISLHSNRKVFVGDAGVRDTTESFDKFGYETLTRSGDVELIDLNQDETVEFWAYAEDFSKKPLGFSKTVAESDFNLVVVPAKMHSYTTVSLSVKTHTIGSQVVRHTPAGLFMRWPWNHTGYRQIHMTMAETFAKFPAHMAVIDGIQTMEGNGPSSGDIVNLGWVIAALNPVSADALAVYLMGLDPHDIGHLVFLEEKGFGPIDVKDMEIIGANPDDLRKEIRRASTYSETLSWKG